MIGSPSKSVVTKYSKQLEIEKARRLPVKKARKNESSYIHRLGYYSLVSNYTGGDSLKKLCGSSINRKIRDREKMERTGIDQRKGRNIGKAVIDKNNGGRESYWVNPAKFSPPEVDRVLSSQQIPNASGRGIHKTFKFDKRADELFPPENRKKLPKVHKFSSRTKGHVKARATAFFRAVTGKRSKIFCTLTFINDVADAIAVRILNKFLTVLRKEKPGLEYLWVAERQMKTTGRIHFHLIINSYLPIRRINSLWVLQQYNSGVVFPGVDLKEITERYASGSIHEILNPVDVKRIRNIGILSSYLSKYISKGNNEGGFGCLTWHCSRRVSQLFLRAIVGSDCVAVARGIENCKVDKRTGEFFGMPEPVREKHGEKFFYTIWYLNQPGRFLCYLREMEQINKWLMDRSATVDDVIEYLGGGITDDNYRKHYLN
jgi:hypothetical protein